jgi:hypothetical protein
MVATLAIAVFYNERNYRLSRRNAELAAEHLRMTKEAAARQAEADGFARRVREHREPEQSRG